MNNYKVYILLVACIGTCALVFATLFSALQSYSTPSEKSQFEFDVYTNINGDPLHSYGAYYVSINGKMYFVAKVTATGRQGEINYHIEYPDHIVEAKISSNITLTKIGKISLDPSSKDFGAVLQCSPITNICVPIFNLPERLVNELKTIATS